MSTGDKADIIRRCFEAYRTGRRDDIEVLLADGFTFTSPYDDAIGKAEYFRRCWPNNALIERHDIETICAAGDHAFVTYLCRMRDGREFRNTEFFRFDSGRIRSVDVYFGASYKDGTFVKQT